MAQLVASMSGVVPGRVVMVVGSNPARGKILTASIGSVDSLYPSVCVCVYIYEFKYKKAAKKLKLSAFCLCLHQSFKIN